MEERLRELEAKIAELAAWKAAREVQQINYPIDEASLNAIRAATYVGQGSGSLTRNINLTGEVQSITVPTSYAGSIQLRAGGTTHTIPTL